MELDDSITQDAATIRIWLPAGSFAQCCVVGQAEI